MPCLPRVLLYILDDSKEDMSSRLPIVSSYKSTQLNAAVLTRKAILDYMQHATANLTSYSCSFNSEGLDSAVAITPAIQHEIEWCTDYSMLKNIGTWTVTSNSPTSFPNTAAVTSRFSFLLGMHSTAEGPPANTCTSPALLHL